MSRYKILDPLAASVPTPAGSECSPAGGKCSTTTKAPLAASVPTITKPKRNAARKRL